jgi:hypothetical protein
MDMNEINQPAVIHAGLIGGAVNFVVGVAIAFIPALLCVAFWIPLVMGLATGALYGMFAKQNGFAIDVRRGGDGRISRWPDCRRGGHRRRDHSGNRVGNRHLRRCHDCADIPRAHWRGRWSGLRMVSEPKQPLHPNYSASLVTAITKTGRIG